MKIPTKKKSIWELYQVGAEAKRADNDLAEFAFKAPVS